MKHADDRLYALLPAVYRQRDFEQGNPLRDLLRVIADQISVIENDIGQLYENWFIETCEDWVVPYIGDLIGYSAVQAADMREVGTEQGRSRNSVLIPRREVANTIRYRRRKGTLSLLEQLAFDIAGWPARAVEFHGLLASNQGLDHRRRRPASFIDLRDASRLQLVGGPFDRAAHTADMRRVGSPYSGGRAGVSSVGLFVWRLKSCSISRAPAYCYEEAGDHCYTFNILGIDAPLFTKPVPEDDPVHIAGEINVPGPIRRGAFEVRKFGEDRGHVSEAYYGAAKSLMIWKASGDDPGVGEPIPIDNIVPADLTDWEYRPKPGDVAVDPVLGRLAFAPGHAPDGVVRVTYHYGFSANIGGGEYPRSLRGGARRRPDPPADKGDTRKKGAASAPSPQVAAARQHCVPLRYRVGKSNAAGSADEIQPDHPSLRAALDQWEQDAPDDAIIEILDSDVYEDQIEIAIKGQRLEIRAASGVRPVLRLVDRRAGRPDALTITAEGGEISFDGLLIAGRALELKGTLSCLTIRDTTLVPGWSLRHDCEPHRPSEPSLTLDNICAPPLKGDKAREHPRRRPTHVHIERSILGSIRVIQDEVASDPTELHITDSIVDATSSELEAIDAPGAQMAHATLTIVRSTIIGRVLTHAIALAEDSILLDEVRVGRRQIGCVRFCYVLPGSRTPRRFNCQPDLAGGSASGADKTAVERRVRPVFNSTRYGAPSYCQLALDCASEIVTGASDQSEMGVFHNLYQPIRLANLQARLEEFVPAGTDAGVIIVS